ncbi:MAG TPA: metal-dependent hydrolase [Solirubrobacterales bacterium]|jgi:L-ascorbate metabolism protein UlaG (beta-lactamase superfamily)|nr:metal-dependent hydrolase [Solirubrobacterales bacterium]
MEIRFHGHSCVQLSEGGHKVLVDPFLKPNNPAAILTADEVDAPSHVLLTHGHADHSADIVAVARRTGAHCIALSEVAKWLAGQGLEASDPNIGGTVETDWGWVKLVQAFHTNTIPGTGDDPFSPEGGIVVGPPAGMVINIGGKSVYHLGDTGLFSDLKLIAERTPVDVALIPIGGHYTMDRHDAAVAAAFVGAGTVIPIHYNTFPAIEADAEAFKSDVESATSSKVVVLEPGETHEA